MVAQTSKPLARPETNIGRRGEPVGGQSGVPTDVGDRIGRACAEDPEKYLVCRNDDHGCQCDGRAEGGYGGSTRFQDGSRQFQ